MKNIRWTNKLFALALTASSFLAGGIAGVGIPSGDQKFNITSPLDHGVYVGGQILPITYVLLQDSSELELNIYIKPQSLNVSTVTVARNADVSENASSIVKINNETHWQHSYNYNIPQTTPAGYYEVIFESVTGHVNTSIPILIRPYVSSTAAAPISTGSSARGPSSANTSRNKSTSSGSKSSRAFMAPLAIVGCSVVVISHILLF